MNKAIYFYKHLGYDIIQFIYFLIRLIQLIIRNGIKCTVILI